jgi:transcriptional regulator
MYQPAFFRVEDRAVLIEAAQRIQLACIVTGAADEMHATHAPCVVKFDDDDIHLEFHIARANPHWQLDLSGPSLAVFQGEQSYIHPGWYPTKAETGKAVPTWTYVTVHMHGMLEVIDNPDELRRHLDELTAVNEAGRPDEWHVSDAPHDYIDKMSRAIVGMRMRVTKVEGAWKLNQHKNEEDHLGVLAGLKESGANAVAVVASMAQARATNERN